LLGIPKAAAAAQSPPIIFIRVILPSISLY